MNESIVFSTIYIGLVTGTGTDNRVFLQKYNHLQPPYVDVFFHDENNSYGIHIF